MLRTEFKVYFNTGTWNTCNRAAHTWNIEFIERRKKYNQRKANQSGVPFI